MERAVVAVGIAIALFVQSPSENLLNQTMAWWYTAAAGTWGFRRLRRSEPEVGDADGGVVTEVAAKIP